MKPSSQITPTLRPFNRTDIQQAQELQALLSEAFGREFLPYYILQVESLATPESTYLLYDAEGLVAHTQIVPYTYKANSSTPPTQVAYLYAICTAKRRQGEGIMRTFLKELLTQHLAQAGYSHALLVPAEIELFDFYSPLGFHKEEGPIYLSAPRGQFPAIRPGTEALSYLASAELLDLQIQDPQPCSTKRPTPFAPLTPAPVGWMSQALTASPFPPDTILINPLT